MRLRGLVQLGLVATVALGLGGCVVYPANPYYGGYDGYGYGYSPYYYGPPFSGTFFFGDRGRRDWR